MKNKLAIFFAILIAAIASVVILGKTSHFNDEIKNNFLLPKEDDDGEDNDIKRKLYFENMHRAAPDVNWRSVEIQNKVNAERELKKLKVNPDYTSQVAETFANGNLTGEWSERGSNNQAGRMVAVDYLPATDKLYSISAGGTLWMGNTDGSNWEVLNQDYQFSPSELKIFLKQSGETRILATAYNIPKYSDDNGATFADANGVDFPIDWSANHISSFTVLNDAAETVYCLVYTWDPISVAPHTWLYRSADNGTSYTSIYQFNNKSDNQVSLCSPVNSAELYALDNSSSTGTSTIYSITGSNVSALNITKDLPVNVNCILKGHRNGAALILYAMTGNDKVYKSVNNGANWTFQSNLPANAWDKFNISPSDPDKICFGGIEAFGSIDGGINWLKINNWVDYYGDPGAKLHADIMALEYFKKADDTRFIICNNDGGMYISYDDLITNNNISLTGLRVGQYYDVLTDPQNSNNIFVGSQDQGLQRSNAANTTEGLLDFTQVTSGDFGDLCLTGHSSHLWTQYPGGNIYYYDDPLNNATGIWSMPGTQKPEYGWLLPVSNTENIILNEIYMAGGNIEGGGGSYLVKITATSPGSFSASQFNYDFRANSNDGFSGISAIGVSSFTDKKIYVATEDGAFFYSDNNGSNWTKSTFTGPRPQYLYGAAIAPSKIVSNMVWYGGSGYSNPAVYKSVDGGQTFTAMSNGLPNTLVHEIAVSPDEKFLFAATEAGPYVYVAAEDNWYSLRGAGVPVQDFFSVEYVTSINTVRFGTYGRGIFDFKLLSALPVTLSSFQVQKIPDQKARLLWTTESEINNDYFIIQRSKDAIAFENIDSINSYGNSSKRQFYSAFDNNPFRGKNFYRIGQKDKNGVITFSKILLLDFSGQIKRFKIFPNPAKNVLNVQVNNLTGKAILQIIDMGGRKIKEEKITLIVGSSISIDIENLQKGTYYLLLKSGSINEQLKFIKE